MEMSLEEKTLYEKLKERYLAITEVNQEYGPDEMTVGKEIEELKAAIAYHSFRIKYDLFSDRKNKIITTQLLKKEIYTLGLYKLTNPNNDTLICDYEYKDVLETIYRIIEYVETEDFMHEIN